MLLAMLCKAAVSGLRLNCSVRRSVLVNLMHTFWYVVLCV
jgi:hypothetical protein